MSQHGMLDTVTSVSASTAVGSGAVCWVKPLLLPVHAHARCRDNAQVLVVLKMMPKKMMLAEKRNALAGELAASSLASSTTS